MKLSPHQVAFLDGYLSAFDDLPDGAWQAACENAIESLEQYRRFDPYDVWLAWVEAKAGKAKVVT